MESRYEHLEHEKRVYQQWLDGGGFTPRDEGESFTIIMPPPNANDPLHVGHAMFVALEDILIRFERMKGKSVLWLPGTDHAGIETQFVFEKKLAKEGKSRFDFDRETLFGMIWDYVQENSGVAVEQMKQLGASADWSRYKFMLEPAIVEDVVETFGKLYEDRLVYRDLKLVNYCTKCGTAYSDLEVSHEERTDALYFIKYGPLSLATVRPETKFGDTGLAVNPKDRRYKKWIGKEIVAEGLLGEVRIRVVADEYVDPKFGTGVVKITPAHDNNDFEVWQRHKDEIEGPKQVIGFDGKLNELSGKYQGMSVVAAREKVVEDLKEKGLLEKVETNYVHNVAVCYRCGRVLEPLPMPQFYVRVKPLTAPVIESINEGGLKIYGAGYKKILMHWLRNLKDWNVSRQIVWGIRMPVWYEISEKSDISVVFLDDNGNKQQGRLVDLLKAYSIEQIKNNLQSVRASLDTKFVVSPTPPGKDYIQETDTFDTWFSSAQWPVNSLRNAEAGDFDRYYPTSVMETGYDILPFWVMRMLMMGKYLTGKLPFEKVYLHGLIRDAKGEKMSKSKGNVINPLEVVEKYGADALRMALVIRSSAGLDKNVGDQEVRAMRNLTNKIWNAARYVLMSVASKKAVDGKSDNYEAEFEKRLRQVVSEVEKQLESFRIGMAAETVYNEFWHWYCDVAIEKNKSGELSDKSLMAGLVTMLKLLHPFVPFVSEAVYQELRREVEKMGGFGELVAEKELMTSKWPKPISA